jgi:hypothetical protein
LIEPSAYVAEMVRDMQVGGLAMFLYVGSPQSEEGDDRKEAQIDAILRRLNAENGEQTIRRLDREFQRQ